MARRPGVTGPKPQPGPVVQPNPVYASVSKPAEVSYTFVIDGTTVSGAVAWPPPSRRMARRRILDTLAGALDDLTSQATGEGD
jgi:hypothetical protein